MSNSVDTSLQDSIALEVHKLYDSLSKSGKPKEGEEWTCLAGFVVEDDGDFKVVSMATGTKCIGGRSMVFDGSLVHDSHAEVLARRALLRYFYDQIGLAKRGNDSRIFAKSGNVYMLKPDVKFHFYASQVPCGDGSIIPMENSLEPGKKRKMESSDEASTKRLKADVHRTGAKPVEMDPRQDPKLKGVDYHVRGAVRIKPGRGDPTKSLSCSDKICKWLFCGLQGALLSLLIPEPIELSAMVIGGAGPYNESVLAEALFSRSGLARAPRLLRSSLVFKHSPEATGTVRPCASSICWTDALEKKFEVSVEGRRLGVTKANKGKARLLVSKLELFKNFIASTDEPAYKEMSYGNVKLLSASYQDRKKRFVSVMGCWAEDKSAYEDFLS